MAKVTRYYRVKKADGTFEQEPIYFGTYANYVTLRRPDGTSDGSNNVTDLQTYINGLASGGTVQWRVLQ